MAYFFLTKQHFLQMSSINVCHTMCYNTYNILGTAKAQDWNSSPYTNYSRENICILSLDKKKKEKSQYIKVL